MKRPVLSRTRALALFLFFPLATVPIIYGAKEFETIASWYGPGFQGRRTANGERYDQNAMTAASKTLPFGTRVVVYNPRNDRRCVVTINDRGPYVPGRGIDLSHAAARKLGISGIAPVICFAGGTSYTDIAQKEKHHKHNTVPEAPLAVPAPESSDTNTIASKPETFAPINAAAGPKKDLVSLIPPHNSGTDNVGELNSAENTRSSGVQERTVSTTPPIPKIEQIATQKNEKVTAARSENSPPQLIQSIKLVELPKTQPVPVVVKTIDSTTAQSLPPKVNEQYAMPAGRKPGELLAAALATPSVYTTPNLTAHVIAINPEQTVPRASMLPRGGFVVAPSAPSIISVRPQPARSVARTNRRTYIVVGHRHVGYSRHVRYRSGRSDDLIDRVASKIGRVCKKVLASL